MNPKPFFRWCLILGIYVFILKWLQNRLWTPQSRRLWTSTKHLIVLATTTITHLRTLTSVWFCSAFLFFPPRLQFFEARKPLSATPDSAFHSAEQQRYSQTYSELPGEPLRGDLQQHPQEALLGQVFPFPDRWPCTAALKWDSYTDWKDGWKLWLRFLTLLAVSFTVSSMPEPNSTTWLSKSTPCADYGSGTKREIPVNAAMCHAVCRWLHSTTGVCFLHLL